MEDLIFDRSQSDVDHVINVTRRISNGTALDEETAEFLQGRMKGSWNYTDLNRIESWTAYLYDILLQNGYTAVITPRNLDRPGGGILPDGYTQLEYIQSSGTQYIDTGFKPNQNTRITASVFFTDTLPNYSAAFGARTGDTDQFWFMWSNAHTLFQARYGVSRMTIYETPKSRNEIDYNKNRITVDGSTSTITAETFESSYNAYLFGTNNSGSLQYSSSMKLYSCKIYDNGVLVRDFCPCKNPAGAAGLYDIASNVFYGNAGTGTFAAGPEIVPDEPEPSDDLWIESDIPYRSEIDRIRANVDALQTGFASLPDWQEIVYNNTMTFGQANVLEWDLQRLYDWLQAMINGFMTKQANTLFMVAGGVFNN